MLENEFVSELKKTFKDGFFKVVVSFTIPVGVNFAIQEHNEFELDGESSTTCKFMAVQLNVNTDDDIETSAASFPFLS
eukprot:scaffold75341_cov36-Attheya_sp.AAC.1